MYINTFVKAAKHLSLAIVRVLLLYTFILTHNHTFHSAGHNCTFFSTSPPIPHYFSGSPCWAAGSVKLHLYCKGPATPGLSTFIMEGGGGSPGVSYDPIVEALAAAGRRACWYDRLGYGWSDDIILPWQSSMVSPSASFGGFVAVYTSAAKFVDAALCAASFMRRNLQHVWILVRKLLCRALRSHNGPPAVYLYENQLQNFMPGIVTCKVRRCFPQLL